MFEVPISSLTPEERKSAVRYWKDVTNHMVRFPLKVGTVQVVKYDDRKYRTLKFSYVYSVVCNKTDSLDQDLTACPEYCVTIKAVHFQLRQILVRREINYYRDLEMYYIDEATQIQCETIDVTENGEDYVDAVNKVIDAIKFFVERSSKTRRETVGRERGKFYQTLVERDEPDGPWCNECASRGCLELIKTGRSTRMRCKNSDMTIARNMSPEEVAFWEKEIATKNSKVICGIWLRNEQKSGYAYFDDPDQVHVFKYVPQSEPEWGENEEEDFC